MDVTQTSPAGSGAAASESVTDGSSAGESVTEFVEMAGEPVNWLDVPFTEYQVSDGILTLIFVLLILGGVLSLVRRFI